MPGMRVCGETQDRTLTLVWSGTCIGARAVLAPDGGRELFRFLPEDEPCRITSMVLVLGFASSSGREGGSRWWHRRRAREPKGSPRGLAKPSGAGSACRSVVVALVRSSVCVRGRGALGGREGPGGSGPSWFHPAATGGSVARLLGSWSVLRARGITLDSPIREVRVPDGARAEDAFPVRLPGASS
jgi:hypothetical protein